VIIALYICCVLIRHGIHFSVNSVVSTR